jgi:tetratricopeptide (TPR) repeat protein
MKKAAIVFLLLTFCICTNAQRKNKQEKKEMAEQIDSLLRKQLNGDVFLSEAAKKSCLCIDSINSSHKSRKEISSEIAACIDKEVMSYQLGSKLMSSMVSTEKNNKIEISQNKEADEYKKYYYDIERFLNDSCPSFKSAAAHENEESEFSTSKNPEAIKAYNTGIKKSELENYKEAIIDFKEAVKIDDRFAFAWDNIGLCSRKLGNYEEALKAYTKSLEIDPKGKLPLQNIPVVYSYMKEYDKAVSAYEKLALIYPDDPETFYGIGNIYAYAIPNMEKSLHNMCKAYNLYIVQKSPYRTDAENAISYIYGQMKKTGKEDDFHKILKEYHISLSK